MFQLWRKISFDTILLFILLIDCLAVYNWVKACENVPNAAKMFVSYRTYSLQGISLPPAARCSCPEYAGDFFYWTPIKTANLLSTSAYSDEYYYLDNFAFVIRPDAEHICTDFCMCTDVGDCYKPLNISHFRAEFLPFCNEPNNCVMYASIYQNLSKFIHENGSSANIPEMLNSTRKSDFFEIFSIGCNGCAELKNARNCSGSTEINPSCVESRLSIGLTLDSSVVKYTAFEQASISVIDGCSCSNGTRFFWDTNVYYDPESKHYNPLPAMLSNPDAQKVALAISSFDQCQNIKIYSGPPCICTKNNECYKSREYSKVYFIPYCSFDYCDMFAVVYRTNIYGQLEFLNGTVYESPNPNDPIIELTLLDQSQYAIDSFAKKFDSIKDDYKIYIHADSVSCSGCESIMDNTCANQNAPNCAIPNDVHVNELLVHSVVGLIIMGDSISAELDNILMPIGRCYCTHGTLLTYTPINESLPFVAIQNHQAAFIIKSGLSYDNELWCLCDEDGICYTPSNPNEFDIKLFPYCEDSECHMYAVVQDNSYKAYPFGRPLIFLNGTFVSSPDIITIKFGPTSGYIKVKTIGRSRNHACTQMVTGFCIGPMIKINSINAVLPIFEYGEADSLVFDAISRVQLLKQNESLRDKGSLELFQLIKEECEMRYIKFEKIITCIQANLASLNKTAEKYIKFYYPNDESIRANVIVNLSFASIGIVASLFLIVLISKNIVLRNGFGILCFVQALNDLVIFATLGILYSMQNYRFLTTRDYTVYIFGTIFDVYALQYICQILCIFLEAIKPLSRFMGHFFPAAFLRFKAKHTFLAMALPVTVISFFSLPLIDDCCKVEYEMKTNGLALNTTINDCLIFYSSAQQYLMIVVAVLSIFSLFSISYVLYKKNGDFVVTRNYEINNKKVERTYLFQNSTCTLWFLIFLILFLVFNQYSKKTNFSSYDLSTNLNSTVQNITTNDSNRSEEIKLDDGTYQNLRFFYETYCAVAIWRCLSELTSFLTQLYLLRIGRE